MAKNSKLTRIIKRNGRLIFYSCVVLAVLLYLALGILPVPTVFITAENHPFTVQGKAYAFKDEEYVIINSTEPLNLLCAEGAKVSASTLLADNYSISTDSYLKTKIEVIDYMLAHPELEESDDVYALIVEYKRTDERLEAELKEAVASGNEAEKTRLASELEYNQFLCALLNRAVEYVNTSDYSLNLLRENYAVWLGRSDIPLTLDNLNFSVFGNLYYSIDGYESVMNFNCLDKIEGAYLDTVDSMNPAAGPAENRYYIKSSAGDKLIVAVRLPLDTYLEKEEKVKAKYDYFHDNYDLDLEGGYYNFLLRRIDELTRYPSLTFTTGDGVDYTGYYIETKQTDTEKIVILALREAVTDFSDKRIFITDVHAQTVRCFSLPSSAVYEREGRYYVTVLQNATQREELEVKIFKTEGKVVYLKTADNEELSSGDEIILKGK